MLMMKFIYTRPSGYASSVVPQTGIHEDDWRNGYHYLLFVDDKLTETFKTYDEYVNWLIPAERRAAWSIESKETVTEQPVDSNVKTAAALGKPKFSDVPPIAFHALGQAMSNGATKYGRFNWRETDVTISVFYDAMMRHLLAFYCGEDHAEDSGVHHLAHVMAGCAIILDAQGSNVLRDDRQLEVAFESFKDIVNVNKPS